MRGRDIVWSHSPNAAIFGGTVPTLRWIGNEEGWAGTTLWSNYHPDYASLNDTKALSQGFADGEAWLPAEVDVSIRPGWFYHEREDSLVKTVDQLMELYEHSVGRNANLLLNFPVNKEGRIPSIDSLRAVEWYQTLQARYANDLLKDCKVTASHTRASRFDPKHVLDEDYTKYWAAEDGIRKAELVFEFPEATEISRLLLQEYIPLGQNVKHFTISRYVNGKWLPIDTEEELTTVGYKRLVRFEPVKVEKLRVRFWVAKGTLCISRMAAY